MARTRAAAAALSSILLLAACAQETGPITSQTNRTADPAPAVTGDDGSTWTAPVSVPGATAPDQEDEQTGPVEVTVGAIGDILSHAPVIANASLNAGGQAGRYDFAPMFAEVEPLLSAPDVTICHMETPLSADNTNLTQPRTLVFNTPREVADALAGAGVDGCDFASNHTMDQGLEGLRQTQEVIEEAGMAYSGPVAEEDRAEEVTVFDVDGVQLAHLAYTYTYPNSGTPTTHVPQPWLERFLWPAIGADGILEQAELARADGADFVVVSMHWGTEYQTEPNADQVELAEALLSSDHVDAIIGTHVHVVQPCETINGKVVAYGLGNFLSNQSPETARGLRPETQEGMVARFTLRRDEDGTITSSMAYQPTRVDLEGHVVRPATPQSHPETVERTAATMDALGQRSCGAQPWG